MTASPAVSDTSNEPATEAATSSTTEETGGRGVLVSVAIASRVSVAVVLLAVFTFLAVAPCESTTVASESVSDPAEKPQVQRGTYMEARPCDVGPDLSVATTSTATGTLTPASSYQQTKAGALYNTDITAAAHDALKVNPGTGSAGNVAAAVRMGVATRDSLDDYTMQESTSLPELRADATTQERKEHLEAQLDHLTGKEIGRDMLVLPGSHNRLGGVCASCIVKLNSPFCTTMCHNISDAQNTAGLDQVLLANRALSLRNIAGQAVVQLVEDTRTKEQQAAKFLLSESMLPSTSLLWQHMFGPNLFVASHLRAPST